MHNSQAVPYTHAEHAKLGISAEWCDTTDVAVLGTYIGLAKEEFSARVTIVTGIVSALKRIPVRNDLAMTGAITIMGKVLPVSGIQQKVRTAFDAGVKEVLLPTDNLKEVEALPGYILDAVKLTPVQSLEDVLRYALVSSTTV